MDSTRQRILRRFATGRNSAGQAPNGLSSSLGRPWCPAFWRRPRISGGVGIAPWDLSQRTTSSSFMDFRIPGVRGSRLELVAPEFCNVFFIVLLEICDSVGQDFLWRNPTMPDLPNLALPLPIHVQMRCAVGGVVPCDVELAIVCNPHETHREREYITSARHEINLDVSLPVQPDDEILFRPGRCFRLAQPAAFPATNWSSVQVSVLTIDRTATPPAPAEPFGVAEWK